MLSGRAPCPQTSVSCLSPFLSLRLLCQCLFLPFDVTCSIFAENPACWIRRWEPRQPGQWCEVRRQPSERPGCRWQRPRSPSVFVAGSPVTLGSPSLSPLTPGALQGGATLQLNVSFSWTCNLGCDLLRVPKLLPEAGPGLLLICVSAEVQREGWGAGARGPFSWVGRGWGGTRSAASPAKVRLCSGEALGVFTPSPPPAAGGAGTLLGSSPEKPATGRVLGPQDVPTVARPTLAASSRSSPPGGPTAAGSAHASRRPALTFAPPSLPFPPDLGVAARFATSVVWRV